MAKWTCRARRLRADVCFSFLIKGKRKMLPVSELNLEGCPDPYENRKIHSHVLQRRLLPLLFTWEYVSVGWKEVQKNCTDFLDILEM